jgi:hypothetical protein
MHVSMQHRWEHRWGTSVVHGRNTQRLILHHALATDRLFSVCLACRAAQCQAVQAGSDAGTLGCAHSTCHEAGGGHWEPTCTAHRPAAQAVLAMLAGWHNSGAMEPPTLNDSRLPSSEAAA